WWARWMAVMCCAAKSADRCISAKRSAKLWPTICCAKAPPPFWKHCEYGRPGYFDSAAATVARTPYLDHPPTGPGHGTAARAAVAGRYRAQSALTGDYPFDAGPGATPAAAES